MRHPDGDTVTLRATLGFTDALSIRNTMAMAVGEPGVTDADILALLTERYLYLGIESWTFVDERGRPVPVTRANIAGILFANPFVAMTVGDEADELYTSAVVLPLLGRRPTSSPRSPTDASTSAPKPSSTPRPKRASPSSTTRSRTDGIATTSESPVGGSF